MDFPGMEMIEPWYQGDHMIFVTQGVPALTLTSSDIFSLIDTVVHTEKDTAEFTEWKDYSRSQPVHCPSNQRVQDVGLKESPRSKPGKPD
jgi:hypothetical protein